MNRIGGDHGRAGGEDAQEQPPGLQVEDPLLPLDVPGVHPHPELLTLGPEQEVPDGAEGGLGLREKVPGQRSGLSARGLLDIGPKLPNHPSDQA